jgi:hypothetical protein
MTFLVTSPQSRLNHAVQLQGLARSDAQGIVPELAGQPVERQIVLGPHHPSRQASADHKNILFACLALVAIITLINPVKLEEFAVVIRKAIHCGICKRGANGPGQGRAGCLQFFIARGFYS